MSGFDSDSVLLPLEVYIYDCHVAKEEDPSFYPDEECVDEQKINRAMID